MVQGRIAVVSLLLCGCGATVACSSDPVPCSADPYCSTAYAYAYPYDPYYYTMGTYYDPVAGVYYAPASVDGGSHDAGDGGARTLQIPQLLAKAYDGATAINQGVHLVIDPIRDLVKMTPTQNGDTTTFGPMNRGAASYRFSIRQLSAPENRFGWRLTARPASSSDEYAVVAGGTIRRADAPYTGTGVFGLDGDALSQADSSVHSRGRLRLGFASDSTKKVLRFAVDAYTPDENTTPPMNATAAGYTLDQTESASRVALLTNLSETETAAEELVVIKVHSKKDVGTRADAIATGGDIDESKALRVTTCVDQGLAPTASETSTRVCSAGGADCDQISGPADLACAGGLSADDPAPSATADDNPQGMPSTPEVPSAVSDGTE